jgi:hypothetical protein
VWFLSWKIKPFLNRNNLPVISITLGYQCARGHIFVNSRLFLGILDTNSALIHYKNSRNYFLASKLVNPILCEPLFEYLSMGMRLVCYNVLVLVCFKKRVLWFLVFRKTLKLICVWFWTKTNLVEFSHIIPTCRYNCSPLVWYWEVLSNWLGF